MPQVLLWALGTGFVTGAVWFAIVFFRRHPTQVNEPPVLPSSEQGEGESLSMDHLTRRLLEVEERLDATEQLLKRERIGQLRKPPSK
jgi:hypothetical protein